MSFTQSFTSSPISPVTNRKRCSRFTYKHLSTFAQSSTTCPLRVVAHIDLDAFYAQCEMVRLGIPPDQPLAVQQWQGLIAINYPARAFGLNRHVTIAEAKSKCPQIICQHVATWKEGDAKWSYADDAWKEIATRKVSLDPYRLESRRILATIKAALPAESQRVEKASVDEVFLDLSAQVHGILLERYPELRGPPPYDDPSEPLPRPPTTVLDWAADALVDLDESQSEEDDPDWDDVVMLLASEIVRDVRKTIFDELKYTCSAGISKNKMLAKLGSGHKKPNSQTVIRNRAVQHFLSGFKFTKIRNLGGKLGDEVVAAFNTDTVSDILSIPIEQLKKKFGDDTGAWLHGVLRGEDNSEVNPRTQIKSMLSAKSFRPAINGMDVACKWLRIFVADIFGRLVEEGVLENKRRPKSINLHHRQGQQSRSRQAPIPLGKAITEDMLFELSKSLMAQVIVDGRAWPCINLSLSVGGFEDGVANNKGIGGFLVRGEEARALQEASLSREDSTDSGWDNPRPNKKRKINAGDISNFFGAALQQTRDPVGDMENDESDPTPPILHEETPNNIERLEVEHNQDGEGQWLEDDYDDDNDPDNETKADTHPDQSTIPPPSAQPTSDLSNSSPSRNNEQHLQQSTTVVSPTQPSPQFLKPESYTCSRCGQKLFIHEQPEHEDFHFAQDLQKEQSSPSRPPPKPIPPSASSSSSASKQSKQSKGRGRPPVVLGPEKGQKKLAFG